MSKYSDKTNYASIYKMTYWGGNDFEETKKTLCGKDIFENRNKFVSDYGIVRISKKKPQYIREEIDRNRSAVIKIDHSEVYVVNDKKYVVVSSPYFGNDENISKKLDKQYENMGWTKIYKMYSEDANTYIKIIPFRK